MALQITSRRVPTQKGKLVAVFFAVFALLVQPLVSLNIPSVFAAGITVSPANHTIQAGGSPVSNVNATGYNQLKVSFSYNAENLDGGDKFQYGWKQGANSVQLGFVNGKNEGGSGAATDETGAVTNLALPTSLNDSSFQLYFANTGETAGAGDEITITNISVTGAAIPAPDPVIVDTTKPTVALTGPVDGALNPVEYTVSAHDNDKLAVVTGNLYKGLVLVNSCSVGSLDVSDYILSCLVPAGLSNGTYTIRYNALDKSGNLATTATSDFVIDGTNPGLYLKASSVGSIAQRILREADFKLTDNNKVAAYHVNGIRKPVTPNAYSDANDIKVGAYGGKYGTNVIQSEDTAGNKSDEFTFVLDNVKPTIEVKDESVGLNDTYKTVSFKLYDAYMIDRIILNGVEKDLTDNQWSDLNGVKPNVFGGQEGANTLKVYDVAGNEAKYSFTLDTVAPTGEFAYSPSNDVIKKGPVTITLTTSEPIQTPSGWTKVDDITFTLEVTENIKESLVITDYAGNNSTPLKYEVKRIDNTAPEMQGVTDGVTLGADLAGFKVFDQNFKEVTVNGSLVECTYDGGGWLWSCPGVTGDGSYTLVATDKAGNSTTVSFRIDTTAPVLKLNTALLLADGRYQFTGTTTDVDAPVNVYLDGVLLGQAIVEATGVWSYTTEGEVLPGSYTVSADSTDGLNSSVLVSLLFTRPAVSGPPVFIPSTPLVEVEPETDPTTPTTGTPTFVTFVNNTGTTDDDGEVLGTKDVKKNVAATPTSAVETSEEGWKFAGIAWYWWLLGLGAAGGTGWWLLGAYRRRGEE